MYPPSQNFGGRAFNSLDQSLDHQIKNHQITTSLNNQMNCGMYWIRTNDPYPVKVVL
jgi:hypothetical protein